MTSVAGTQCVIAAKMVRVSKPTGAQVCLTTACIGDWVAKGPSSSREQAARDDAAAMASHRKLALRQLDGGVAQICAVRRTPVRSERDRDSP